MKSLILKKCAQITDDGIALVAQECRVLEKIDLDSCTLISDKGKLIAQFF